MNYMAWKGYSPWFGLFGYLLLPGLIILVCFPNKRKPRRNYGPDEIAEVEPVLEERRTPWYLVLPALGPLALFFVVLGGVGFLHSRIDPGEWQQLSPPGVGFQALMPGTPREEQRMQETPAGRVELRNFTVQPKNKKELFMIVSIHFPEGVGDQLGGPEKLLELGRRDLVTASGGQLKSEKRITQNGSPGLEFEVLPPKGAIIKARVFATRSQVYQLSAHVPQVRGASEDVQKFLDSFQLAQAR
jgi:hypothetical protein